MTKMNNRMTQSVLAIEKREPAGHGLYHWMVNPTAEKTRIARRSIEAGVDFWRSEESILILGRRGFANQLGAQRATVGRHDGSKITRTIAEIRQKSIFRSFVSSLSQSLFNGFERFEHDCGGCRR